MRFEGELLRPGDQVDAAAGAVVLEMAGCDAPGRGHRRPEQLYILWQLEGETWRELARTRAVGGEWAEDLAAPARRALEARCEAPGAGCQEAAAHVLEVLEEELDRLDQAGRRRVLDRVWEEFAARVVEWAA